MASLFSSDSVIRNVYLDTSVFRKASFNFHSKRFQSLLHLSREEKIFLKITDVNIHEIHSQIRLLLGAAQQEHNQFRKKAYILRSVSIPEIRDLVCSFEFEKYEADLVSQVTDFLLQAKVETIFIDEVVPSLIFDQYFLQEPPFSKKSKKKAEFPDAFVIESLKFWCNKYKQSLYVVSSDNDFAEACKTVPSLIHVKTIEEVIDIIITAEKVELESKVRLLIQNQIMSITQEVKNAMKNAQIGLIGEPVELELTEIENLIIERESLLEIGSQFAVIQYQFEAIFRANQHYPDVISNLKYLDVDADLQTQVQVEDDLSWLAKFSAEVWVQFSEIDPYQIYVEKVILNDAGIISAEYFDS